MAQRAGSKNELIKCEYCGEMYAASYKHCPFCNEDGTGRWNVDDDGEEVAGGKRLAGGGRRAGGSSGGQGPSVRRVISMVVSLALIIAAAGIVISIVRSLTGGKDPAANASPIPSQPATVSAAPSVDPNAAPSDPVVEPTPITSQPPVPVVTSPVAELTTPTGFKLNRKDFTLDHAGETFQMKITYTPENARGDVAWKSSNPNVASVSWNGVVTAVSQGTVTLTATVAGVGDQTCIVRCNFKDASGSTATAPAPTQAPSGGSSSGGSSSGSSSASGLKLSRDDITLKLSHPETGKPESWRLTVSGTSSAVTWASSKPDVATVSADGTVTAVSSGTTNITATVDGVTLKCIVRCN